MADPLNTRLKGTVSRRECLRAIAAIGAAPMVNRGRYRLFAQSRAEYSSRAVALVGESLVIDMLSPMTLNFPLQQKWFTQPETFTEADFRKYRDSGINVFHIATGIGGENAYEETLLYVSGWNAFLAGQDEHLMRIDSAGDLAHVHRSGKVGVLIGIQNAEHFRKVEDVNLFYGLGQRVSLLTYNARNMIGDGSTERTNAGLSDFGVAIVERMNQVGMAVDVSHSGDQTTLDACTVSKRPVLFSHANARALNPKQPRCKTDEAIRAMAKSGGVMGITGVRMFVKGEEPTTIEDVLAHFDHVRDLVGVQHLGVGSDIDLNGYDAMPPELNKQLRAAYKASYAFRDKIDIEGLNHPKRMFDLTEGLIRRRYSDDSIRGILGGNFSRVLGEIWRPPA